MEYFLVDDKWRKKLRKDLITEGHESMLPDALGSKGARKNYVKTVLLIQSPGPAWHKNQSVLHSYT